MTFQLISAEEWTKRCNADGEFSIAARHWNGGIKIIAEATTVCIGIENGIACNPILDTDTHGSCFGNDFYAPIPMASRDTEFSVSVAAFCPLFGTN